ncbi:YdcF family protein [Granulicella arctica]|uniref:YdcF family protein n=1 Tax=Granulicella arctica TaxID=940613 RepID=UPI0021E011DA|nr:YdcF family protein [Granulicella arctica]
MRHPVRSLILAALALLILLVAGAIVSYRSIPTGDTSQQRFDTLIVLGSPATPEGKPSPEQRERVLEGIREYRAGIAPTLIMTGGAAHNSFTEAHVMATFARSQGVPNAAIIEEPRAANTIQNIFYSAVIMHQHGWSSAEIISSPSHLPRASLIMQAFDREQPALQFKWHDRAARWPPEYDLAKRLAFYSAEANYCLRLRLFGFPRSKFLPSP